MGCWNETCGISSRSICDGDNVTAFLLINNSHITESYSGQVGIAAPMAFPIHAKYNDYGSIMDPVEDFATKSAIELFNIYYKSGALVCEDFNDLENETNSGYTTDQGFTVEYGFSNVQSIFYAIERGYISLNLTDYTGKLITHQLSFMLILDDSLMCTWETAVGPLSGERPLLIKRGVQQILEYDIVTREKLEKLKIGGDISQWRLYNHTTNPSNNWWFGELGHLPDAHTCMNLASSGHVHLGSFRKLFGIATHLYNDVMSESIINAVFEMVITIDSFDVFRRSWIPQGNTSQTDNFIEVLEYTERYLRTLYVERKSRIESGILEAQPSFVGKLSIFDEGTL